MPDNLTPEELAEGEKLIAELADDHWRYPTHAAPIAWVLNNATALLAAARENAALRQRVEEFEEAARKLRKLVTDYDRQRKGAATDQERLILSAKYDGLMMAALLQQPQQNTHEIWPKAKDANWHDARTPRVGDDVTIEEPESQQEPDEGA